MDTIEVENITEAQRAGIFSFLALRSRFEKIRMNCFLSLGLICVSTLIFNMMNDSALKTWQTVVICVSVVLTGINELVIQKFIQSGIELLNDLGLPPDFARTVASLSLRKLNKELTEKLMS
ncbi:hypothetical protein [Undibacterium oligocarboniphilum]|uniref:Uncharacterized protein n=1 Tax=Undibacterium oligocarboniphilum TaxID=666702 RepID=A0A850QH44_9BURK|nr:hypothetical protein [Undibacterium oligocarboniphilum]MBC3871523.1 hypothetical protein [Undibacterium oligocarboniphilum]NVO78901.1 hypothetical protein [Undibacterium oligocarboniphilum]